jgi:hypothetical protein
MQRTKSVQAYDNDLKEAISSVKAEVYTQALARAHDLDALTTVEHEIRSDFQLIQDDRLRLLGEVERATALAQQRMT